MNVRGITVAVNYNEALEITLHRNMRHLVECLVITSPEDIRAQQIARSVAGVRLHVTDAFYRHGAYFNKGLAMEEGFDTLGRTGQILIWDADVLLPEILPWDLIKPGFLNGCRRRILADPSTYSDDLEWRHLPIHRDGGPIGFFQCFHADDPAIRDHRPWYNVNYPHAGGCDAQFIHHWDTAHRCVLPIDVLHLGQPDHNWFGTTSKAREKMSAYVHRMRWSSAMRHHDPTASERVGDLVERVDVPGYETSDYQMPFERRVSDLKGSRNS